MMLIMQFVVARHLSELVLVSVRGLMEVVLIQKRALGVVAIKLLHALNVLTGMAPLGAMVNVVGTMEVVWKHLQ